MTSTRREIMMFGTAVGTSTRAGFEIHDNDDKNDRNDDLK